MQTHLAPFSNVPDFTSTQRLLRMKQTKQAQPLEGNAYDYVIYTDGRSSTNSFRLSTLQSCPAAAARAYYRLQAIQPTCPCYNRSNGTI